MKDFIELIRILSRDKDVETLRVVDVLQRLYFTNIRPWWKSVKRSEPYYLARDIIEIEQRLDALENIAYQDRIVRFHGLTLKSATLLNDPLMKECLAAQNLERHTLTKVREKIVNQYKHYVAAVIIAEILKQEERKLMIGRTTNVVLAIISGLFALTAALLGYLINLLGGK